MKRRISISQPDFAYSVPETHNGKIFFVSCIDLVKNPFTLVLQLHKITKQTNGTQKIR